jgi:FkbM family methyltransferase
MKKFNSLCDSHFPSGYPDWIQDTIEKNVSEVVVSIQEKFGLVNPIIFDIGSLNGIESVKFTEKFQNCIVHNFEPNPFSFKTVKRNCHDIENIKLHNIAVGDFNGKSDFYITYHNMGASSILAPTILANTLDKIGPFVTPYTVDIVRLDDWCVKNCVPYIDFVWMDVQGAELKVLQGMGDLLNNIKAIYTESSLVPYYEGAAYKDDVINFLKTHNFELIKESYHDEYEGDFLFFKK